MMSATMTAPEVRETRFPEALWEGLYSMISDAYRLTAEERDRFGRSRIARLVAAIPYLAGCDDAERTALAHLSTLVLASRPSTRKAFDHAPSDDPDPMNRLRTVADFRGGNPAIIEKGMCMLGIALLNGYLQDEPSDHESGVYNPFASGAWRANRIVALQERSSAVPMPEMEELMDGFDGIPGWWDV